MAFNLARYKDDLAKLVSLGGTLTMSLAYYVDPEEFRKWVVTAVGREKIKDCLEAVPDFRESYEDWYSESLSLIRQLLPDRLGTFVALYEKPKNRKVLNHDNYTIQDCLQGLQRAAVSVDESAGVPKFHQQLSILKSCKTRFESSLFEIRQLGPVVI